MSTELFSIAGKTALVTGGTRGIGYWIAEGLVRAGARVYLSSRKQDAVDEAVAALSAHGEVIGIAADLSTEENCAALVEEIEKKEDRLHILVNNAGTTWAAPLDEFPDSGWDKVLSLNLKSPFTMTRLLRPLLDAAAVDGDPARVINIGSIDGLSVPGFGNFSYSAAKAGLHHLTRHLAAVLSPTILVNAIAPGPFPTKMMEVPLTERGDEIRAASPVGRIGEPADAAGTAVYLSSRASSFVTGAVLPLDGGFSTTLGVEV